MVSRGSTISTVHRGFRSGSSTYDRVAFINRDRMLRYLAAEVVLPSQAALVGYPKLDKLAAGAFDGSAIRAQYGFENRPTALYAPTYSDASSLHMAGLEIVRALDAAGFNVLVKLHDRSLDPDPRYSGGIDWRARFGTLVAESGSGRIRFVEVPDASPLLAAADLMVTDHSSVGFEFLVLDRPLIVYDAPALATGARVNPEKIALLQSAAVVVTTAASAARAASGALVNPGALSATRQRIAREMFFEPGSATARALELARGLLYPGAPARAAGAGADRRDA